MPVGGERLLWARRPVNGSAESIRARERGGSAV